MILVQTVGLIAIGLLIASLFTGAKQRRDGK